MCRFALAAFLAPRSLLGRHTGPAAGLLVAMLMGLALSACAPLALSRPVTKLGLIAPFEGTQRAVGYEVLYAVKLALREANASGGAGGWQVELVALDGGDAVFAIRQARALAVDPDVTYAIGLAASTKREILQEKYAVLGLPAEFVDPSAGPAAGLDPLFAAQYVAISNGVQPGRLAVKAYAAAKSALAHIAQRVQTVGHPAR